MDEIELKNPGLEDEERVMAFRQDYLVDSALICGSAGLESATDYRDWLDFEKQGRLAYGKDYVRSSTFIAISKKDGQVVGTISLRHFLNSHLSKFGGNIGYAVHPKKRKQGYGHQMLYLILNLCRELGKASVLITCDRDNEASRRTILSCGGSLINEIFNGQTITQRYNIDLNNQQALLNNIDKIHTTTLGAERIGKNLGLDPAKCVEWCLEQIKRLDSYIYLKGKNWYIEVDGVTITINKFSYTIITAHRKYHGL